MPKRQSDNKPVLKNPIRGNLRCVHCKTTCVVRTSEEVDIMLRDIAFQCPNPLCGFTFKASLIFEYGVSPSAQPDPNINVKMRIPPRQLPNEPPTNQITIFDFMPTQ